MRISDWSSDVCSSDLREITERKRLEEHLAALSLTTRLLAPNGRAFAEALDPSAPPASFAQQQLPGAEILAGRDKALVHRQTVLTPGVHVRGPGLDAVHHPAWGLLQELIAADHVVVALLVRPI